MAYLRALTDYFEVLGIGDIPRLTYSNIGDVSDEESDVVAGCVSTCICRPNRYGLVYWATQVRRLTRHHAGPPTVLGPRRRNDAFTPPRRVQQRTPSAACSLGIPKQGATGPRARRRCLIARAVVAASTNVSALLLTKADDIEARHPGVTVLRSFASDPKGRSSKLIAQSTYIRRCPSCNRRGHTARTSCQARASSSRKTT